MTDGKDNTEVKVTAISPKDCQGYKENNCSYYDKTGNKIYGKINCWICYNIGIHPITKELIN